MALFFRCSCLIMMALVAAFGMTCGADDALKNTASAPFDSLGVSAQISVPLNAFTVRNPPEITFAVENKRDTNWQGGVRVQRFDLLNETTDVDWLPIRVAAGKKATLDYKPSVLFGVYRIDFALADDSSATFSASAAQPWLDAQQVRMKVQAREVEVVDLYGRTKIRVPVKDGEVVVAVGEEPVYLREIR